MFILIILQDIVNEGMRYVSIDTCIFLFCHMEAWLIVRARARIHTHTLKGFLFKGRTHSFATAHNGREEASFTYSQSYKPHYFAEFLYIRVILCFISDLYLVITCEFNDATSHTR